MGERAKNQSVVILGVIATVFTIFIQVVKIGEVKGSIDTVIVQHERQLKDHGDQIKGLNKSVDRIEGHLGISASLPVKPSGQKLASQPQPQPQPDTTGPYATP